MNLDHFPFWLQFVLIFLAVALAIESGYRLGTAAHRRSEEEKESPVSAIAGSILGLLAFMLAFTFGIVSNRFDDRRGLVREEANAIRTAYARSDFLPETDRPRATGLLRKYLDLRLNAVACGDRAMMQLTMGESEQIQRELWDMAVTNARKDMNSDVAALYIESLNEVAAVHATRVAVGWQARVPIGIWIALWVQVMLGMAAVGYQTAIAGSNRSPAATVLALSFTIVLALIAALDDSRSNLVKVSQQPLMELRTWMDGPGGR